MDKQEKRKIRKKITIASFSLLAAALLFLVFIALAKPATNMIFYVGISLFLIVYWLLLDVIEPRMLHEFDGITSEQMSAYYKYAGADLIGYAGIAYFVFSIGGTGNSGLFGAVIYILCVSIKRKFKEQFEGTPPQTEEQVEEAEIKEINEKALETDKASQESTNDQGVYSGDIENEGSGGSSEE